METKLAPRVVVSDLLLSDEHEAQMVLQRLTKEELLRGVNRASSERSASYVVFSGFLEDRRPFWATGVIRAGGVLRVQYFDAIDVHYGPEAIL